MSSTARVSSLWVYPVKSLRGIELLAATLTPEGLEHDRRWMVVRENGRFVTQRDWPKLALIHTHLRDGRVLLRRTGFGEIELPVSVQDGQAVLTTVWGDACETRDGGDELADWLTRAAESPRPLRLVQMQVGFVRQLAKEPVYGAGTTTVFADSSPLLLTSVASLQALNESLESAGHGAVAMNRFRPNIVVDGLPPFAEHQLAELSGKHYQLQLREACERCQVPTIDQDTAVADPRQQPFRMLVEINPMPGKRSPAFGVNTVLASGAGAAIRVGDTLETSSD